MNVKIIVEKTKIKAAELREQAHLNNPIRLRKERKHNEAIDALIQANGGQLPEEMLEHTLYGQIVKFLGEN